MTFPVAFEAGRTAMSITPPSANDQDQLGKAAQQFEAIFLRQMLSAARATDFGGEDLFGGQGEETFREMRDARFAEVASETGAIGLADVIEKQLARFTGQGR